MFYIAPVQATQEAADDASEAGDPDVALKMAPLQATDESAGFEEPNLAGENAPVQAIKQAGEVAFTEADAEEDEDDEDR